MPSFLHLIMQLSSLVLTLLLVLPFVSAACDDLTQGLALRAACPTLGDEVFNGPMVTKMGGSGFVEQVTPCRAQTCRSFLAKGYPDSSDCDSAANMKKLYSALATLCGKIASGSVTAQDVSKYFVAVGADSKEAMSFTGELSPASRDKDADDAAPMSAGPAPWQTSMAPTAGLAMSVLVLTLVSVIVAV